MKLPKFIPTEREVESVAVPRVLICSLGNQFEGQAMLDGEVYSSFYRGVKRITVDTVSETDRAIGEGFDVVHLFCRTRATGNIEDQDNAEIPGAQLIKICSEASVKLLWIASENPPENLVAAFKGAGRQLTLDSKPRDN